MTENIKVIDDLLSIAQKRYPRTLVWFGIISCCQWNDRANYCHICKEGHTYKCFICDEEFKSMYFPLDIVKRHKEKHSKLLTFI